MKEQFLHGLFFGSGFFVAMFLLEALRDLIRRG